MILKSKIHSYDVYEKLVLNIKAGIYLKKGKKKNFH
jgi:hypothetical protein